MFCFRNLFSSAILFCLLCSQVKADTEIVYRGLSIGKARINIDGRTIKLAPGQQSKQGVKLLTANKKYITVIVNGKRYKYEKGNVKGIPLDNEVQLIKNPVNGHYFAKGAINGKSATFLVDTGASFIVLNKNDAKALNLKYGKKKIKVSTASKDEEAFLITLKSVRIGNIELKDITAVISNNNEHPRLPLLGMSFLDKLKISQSGDQMSLIYSGN